MDANLSDRTFRVINSIGRSDPGDDYEYVQKESLIWNMTRKY